MLLKIIPDAVSNSTPVCLTGDDSVLGAAQIMRAHQIGAVLVQDKDKLEGLVTDRDLSRRVVAQGLAPELTKLRDVMTTDVTVVRGEETVISALNLMTHKSIRHLPVMDGTVLAGVVAIRDIYGAAARQMEQELDQLEELPSARSLVVKDIKAVDQLISLPPEALVRDLAILMSDNNIGAIPVLAAGKLVGIVTERDVAARVVAVGASAGSTTLQDVMTVSPKTASPEDTCASVLEHMQIGGFRHMPILQGDEPVGIVSIRDLNRYVLATLETDFQEAMLARTRLMMTQG